MLLENINVTLR